MAYFAYTREDRDKPKCLYWYNESGGDEKDKDKCLFFNGEGIYRKVKKDKNFLDILTNFKFYPCRDFLARMDKKFKG